MKKITLIIGSIILQTMAFSQNIIKGEYFVDNDPGFSLAIPFSVNPQSDLLLDSVLHPASILPGYHKLYMRFRDDDGNWSHTLRRNIEVINSSSFLISGAEYFFNADPGIGNANSIYFTNTSTDGSFTFKIPIENIPVGAHTLYIRSKDSTNLNYSITQWQRDSIITTTGVDSLWSHPATWSSNKVPDANTNVLIYHNVVGDTAGLCKFLYISNLGRLRVEAGKSVYISGQ
ncbi:MAG: hypothetical protein ABI402_10345 [Ferruginibacter sp.]